MSTDGFSEPPNLMRIRILETKFAGKMWALD